MNGASLNYKWQTVPGIIVLMIVQSAIYLSVQPDKLCVSVASTNCCRNEKVN